MISRTREYLPALELNIIHAQSQHTSSSNELFNSVLNNDGDVEFCKTIIRHFDLWNYIVGLVKLTNTNTILILRRSENTG